MLISRNGSAPQAMPALIVHPDPECCDFIAEVLRSQGYRVTLMVDGREAQDHLRNHGYELIVLGLDLPAPTDPMRLLWAINWRWPETATMIVTQSRAMKPAIRAANQGVDGYVVMPVEAAELVQAIEEALAHRDARRFTRPQSKRLRWRGLVLDIDRRKVTRDGEAVELTPSQFRLLRYLIRHPGQPVPATELATVIKGEPVGSEETARPIVRWHIHQLRRKLEPDPKNPTYIDTVVGVGYRLNASD